MPSDTDTFAPSDWQLVGSAKQEQSLREAARIAAAKAEEARLARVAVENAAAAQIGAVVRRQQGRAAAAERARIMREEAAEAARVTAAKAEERLARGLKPREKPQRRMLSGWARRLRSLQQRQQRRGLRPLMETCVHTHILLRPACPDTTLQHTHCTTPNSSAGWT